MPVEPLRIVVDRWEWDALAQLAPTIYHEQSWTLASVRRIRLQTSKPVTFGYARVWVDDTLVGCPLIRQSDGPWFNTPRAVPMVLQGVNLNAAGAVLRAIARIGLDPTKPDKKPPAESFIELHDDSELVGAIARARLAIDAHCVRWRRYRSMTGREIDEMVNSLRWTQRAKAREWGDALRATWNAGSWSTEVHVHYDDDDSIVGYTVWVTRTGAVSGRLPHPAECIAAATIGERVPAWTVSR